MRRNLQEERDATGKLLNYNCKLCDCKFSDPNAKDIHLKGRRHRMQYKLKVGVEIMDMQHEYCTQNVLEV